MDIRRASKDDATEILRVHSESIRGLGKTVYTDEQVDAWDRDDREPSDYTEPIQNEGSHLFVAETDGDIAGFGRLDLDTDDPREAEITAVYIHPDHARQGVGKALLEKLEEIACENGVEKLELLGTLNAVPFYEDAGYRSVEEVEHTLTGGEDVTVTCVKMEKEL